MRNLVLVMFLIEALSFICAMGYMAGGEFPRIVVWSRREWVFRVVLQIAFLVISAYVLWVPR